MSAPHRAGRAGTWAARARGLVAAACGASLGELSDDAVLALHYEVGLLAAEVQRLRSRVDEVWAARAARKARQAATIAPVHP